MSADRTLSLPVGDDGRTRISIDAPGQSAQSIAAADLGPELASDLINEVAAANGLRVEVSTAE
jgi:hypothetical protein